MTYEHNLIERAVQVLAPQEPSFEGLLRRRDRRRRNQRLAAGAVALVVAVTGTVVALQAFSGGPRTTGGPPPRLPGNGDIAFVGRDLSENATLYLVDPAGGVPRTLLNGGCAAGLGDPWNCDDLGIGSLDWAPDGAQLAFALWASPAGIGDHAGIYVLDIETEEIRQLTRCTTPCSGQGEIDWSPDGSRIAFTQQGAVDCNEGSCSLYTMKADGTDPVPLSTGSIADAVDPSWAPDGSTIAFSGRVGDQWFVYSTDLNGSEPVRLAGDLAAPRSSQPAWSPDGSRIAFLTDGGGSGEEGLPFELWSMATDGTDRKFLLAGCCRIGGGGFAAQGPEWSPDGTRILLLGGSGARLEVIDPDTGKATSGAVAFGPIAWQPVP